MNNINKAEEEIKDREPVVRTDGMTNTISTVQKDNLLVESNRGGAEEAPN